VTIAALGSIKVLLVEDDTRRALGKA